MRPPLFWAAVCAALVLLVGASAAAATTTALIGPTDNTATADSNALTCTDATSLDCVLFNVSDNEGGLLGAPANGTLTSWTAGGLEGKGQLVVMAPEPGGKYEIVAKSVPESEPCIPAQGLPCGATFLPSVPVYTFPTNLPIAAGDMLGIELLGDSRCLVQSENGLGCAYIGTNGSRTPGGPLTGSSDGFITTPPIDTPTGPSYAAALGEQVLVDATEQLTDVSALQLKNLQAACQAAPNQSIQGLLSASGYTLQFNSAQAGQVDANLDYNGSSGGSVLTYGGSSGGSVLVYNGSGGGSVLVYEGSGGGSTVLVYDGSGGGSVLTYNGSGGGSSVLTYDGSGGGSSVAADLPAAAAGGLSCGASFNSAFANTATARPPAKKLSAIKLCIRKSKQAKPHCLEFKRVSLPAIATVSQRVPAAGKVTLHLKLTKVGRLLLLAANHADVVYRQHHRHAHKLPALPVRLALAFTPAA